ncbi:hypothetical protein [Pedobacter sp. HDW13]
MRNVLCVKISVRNFESGTNFSVITNDGPLQCVLQFLSGYI